MRVIILNLLTLTIFISRTTSNKRLLGSPGFNSVDAWESGYLPCALEEVIFPETYPAVLPLPSKVDISGFVLPRDGALLLNDESTITLGGESQQRECENGRARRAYLKSPITRKWYDPSSWTSPSSQAQNTAMSHLERVPCDNETVVMSRTGPISVDLENTAYIKVGHLNLAGSLISSDYLNYLIHTDIGQLLFRNSLDTIAQYYHQDTCGCHMDLLMFSEPICKNVAGTCERPHCLVPVKPIGSCCPICGAVLSFKMDYCSDKNINKLRKLIATSIKDQELTADLDYHIDYMNAEPYGIFLETTIVDRNVYTEKSVRFMAQLNTSTDWTKVFESTHKLEVFISGRPYNPNITLGSVLLIIICVLFVSVVALVIFAHYAPDHRYLRYLPQWVYNPRRWRAFLIRSSDMFARFDNVAAGGGDADVAEGIVMGYDAESGQVRERSFNNPLFGEKPKGTATESASTSANTTTATTTGNTSIAPATGTKTKTQKVTVKSGGNKLESITLVDAMDIGDVEEEQELNEITLEDLSSGDSDEEEETKE